MIILNGVELELDIFDADTAERYEQAVDMLSKTPKTERIKMSEAIRSESKHAREFINLLFGEGVGEKVIPKDNLDIAFIVVEQIVAEFVKQSEKVQEYKSRINQYSANRAMRRA